MLAATVAGSANAAGFRNPPEGAALGHVGGKIVQSKDASAVTHNPANLTDLAAPQFMGALTIVRGEAEYTDLAGGTTTTDDPWKYLPNLYVAWPLPAKRLALGLGITTPYGQSTVWDKDNPLFPFRYTAPYSAELMVLNFNPTVAAKLTDELSLGAGVDVFWSRFQLQQLFPWAMLLGAAAPEGTMDVDLTGMGLGLNAAATWRPLPRHGLALTCRSPVKVDYDGDFDVSGAPDPTLLPPTLPPLTGHSDADTEIEFPAVVAFGYAFNITERVTLEANVEWVQFSSFDELELNTGIHNILLHAPTDPDPLAPATIREDWDDTWNAGLGADWRITDALTLRAGYIFLQSPIPDETLAPTLPESDRHVLSLGAGFRHGRHSVDAAYAYSLFADREVSLAESPVFAGTYEMSSHLIGLSYGFSL
jgi:long-chain fatty acid transport protein